MDVYDRSTTRLICDGWESEPISPTCGVKQGDPLSPIIFNMIIDGLLKLIPPEVGVDIGDEHFNAFAFADDLVFVASTPMGLQTTLDLATNYLARCGLAVNANKSFTVSIRNVPHVKKTVVDSTTHFYCLGQKMPSLRRADEWKYLGVPFTPEGRSNGQEVEQLRAALTKLTRAPLKPQQRLFALRVMVLPGTYHLLTLGRTTLSRLKKIDSMVREATRKWLSLPHDVVNAYFHADVKDGGLSLPSMRWLMPLRRRQRLLKLFGERHEAFPFLQQEIEKSRRRLLDRHEDLDKAHKVAQRWAKALHASVDGKALTDSANVPQQHKWITDGNRLLSGKDYVNMNKLRINAMPTRSRTQRGRPGDRICRAGCNEAETTNHVIQRCHRTHGARIDRHNAIVAYAKRALEKTCEKVDEEPKFITPNGLRKPDLIAKRGKTAIVTDAQVVGQHSDLKAAHLHKVEYYRNLKEDIKTRYKTEDVIFSSITLSYRGIWSEPSARSTLELGIFKKNELKIVSTRVLAGGLNAFWTFNRSTVCRQRRGIG